MLSRRLLRIKVVKALYSHFKSESDSPSTSEKNLKTSIDRTYDLYHQMLWLVVDVARYAEKRIELGRQKKLPTYEDLHPNTRFIDNEVIRQLEESKTLGEYLQKKGLGWVQYPEVIKSLYNALIASDYYKKYMESTETSYRADLQLVENFFTFTVEDNPQTEDAVEEQSILWADDMDFALIMVVRTLDNFRRNQRDVPLLPEFKNEDDEAFAPELFRKTLRNYDQYIGDIEKFTQNWDVDRIAFTDNLIMATAIAELVNFPSIPVKVTLDEYIEIAKYYSTRGSSNFINGILDKVIEMLEKEGKINKAGRGLL